MTERRGERLPVASVHAASIYRAYAVIDFKAATLAVRRSPVTGGIEESV